MTSSVLVRTYSLYFDFLNSKNLDDTFDRLFTDGFVTSNYRDNDGGNGGGNDVEFCDRQQKQANEGKSSPSSHDDIADFYEQMVRPPTATTLRMGLWK